MTGFLALEVAVATLSSPDLEFASYNHSNKDDDEYNDNDYWSPPPLVDNKKSTTIAALRRPPFSIATTTKASTTTTTPAPAKFNANYFSTHRFLVPSTMPTTSTKPPLTFEAGNSLNYADDDFLNFDVNNMNITDDYTNVDKAPDPDESGSLLLTITLSTLLFVIIAWTIIGNLIVFVCYMNEKRLRTLSNLLILNLACCDLALAILVLPFSASYLVQGKWIFGELWCEIWLSTDVLFTTCSIWAIVAIGYDRYQAIHALSSGGSGSTSPNNATAAPSGGLQRRNLQTTISLCVAVWVLSGIISIPPLIGWKTTDLYTYNEKLDSAQCILFNTQGYVLYSASGSFFVPSIFIVVVYGKIFHAYMIWIRKRKTQLTSQNPTAATATTSGGDELRKTTTTSSLSRRQGSQSSHTSGMTPIKTNHAGLLLPSTAGSTSRSKSDAFFSVKKHQRTSSRSTVDNVSNNEISSSSVNNTPSHRLVNETMKSTNKKRNGVQKSPAHDQVSVSITNSTGSEDQKTEEPTHTESGSVKPTSFCNSGKSPAKKLLLGTPWSPINKIGSKHQLLVPSAFLNHTSNSESSEIPAGTSSSDINSSPQQDLIGTRPTSSPSKFARLLTPHWCPSSSPPPSSLTTSSSCCGSKRRQKANSTVSTYDDKRILQQLQMQTLASLSKLSAFNSKNFLNDQALVNGGPAAVVRQNSEKQFSSLPHNNSNAVNRSNSVGISFYPFTLRLNNCNQSTMVNGNALPATNGSCVHDNARIDTIVDETKIGRENNNDDDDQQAAAFLNLVRPRAASSQSTQQRRHKSSATPSDICTIHSSKSMKTGGLFGSIWRLSKAFHNAASMQQKSGSGTVEGSGGGEASADFEDESVINDRDSETQAPAAALRDARVSQPYISTVNTTTQQTGSGRTKSAAAVQAKQLIDAQNQKRLARRQAREARGLKIVFGILITYFVCYTGFFIMYIVQGFCPPESCPLPLVVVHTVIWLGYAQSAINPLMYFYTNRDFRTAFLNMIGWTPNKGSQQQRGRRVP